MGMGDGLEEERVAHPWLWQHLLELALIFFFLFLSLQVTRVSPLDSTSYYSDKVATAT